MAAIAAADIAESKRESEREREWERWEMGRWEERWRMEGTL